MRGTKIIAIITLISLILSLCSCIEIYPTVDGGSGSNGGQSNNQSQGQNVTDNSGEETEDESETNDDVQGVEGKIVYVYSVISKTLHLPDCYHTERMNEDYKFTFDGDINEMLNKGYTICKDCLVPDDEKEEEKQEEKEPEAEEFLVSKEEATYATNKKSLVVHNVDCYIIESMIAENLRYTNLTYEELLALKYRPCGTCMEEEYKQYKLDHPELFEKD